jgi:hypothetical protein
VARWFSRRKKSDGAKKGVGGKRGKAGGRTGRGRTKTDHRHQPAPLTWGSPDQDFITRYGDPFDG